MVAARQKASLSLPSGLPCPVHASDMWLAYGLHIYLPTPICTMEETMRTQAGFTLIELMIVVAIAGILAAVAIPQYSDYTMRARISNVLAAAAPLKTAVALCVQEHGGEAAACATTTEAMPTGIPVFNRTREVASASVSQGNIELLLAPDLGTDIGGQTITMSMRPGDSSLAWVNATTVTAAVAREAILRNNPPPVVASL